MNDQKKGNDFEKVSDNATEKVKKEELLPVLPANL